MISPADSKAISVRTKKNRTKALEVDLTYVMFLAVMCLLTVFVCVRYLQLKEIITTQTRTNTRLTAELDTLKNENDALLENVTNELYYTAFSTPDIAEECHPGREGIQCAPE